MSETQQPQQTETTTPHFKLDGKVLSLNSETTDLSAFQWKIPITSPGTKPASILMYLVFEDDQVHVIQLEPEKGEKPIKTVESLTQKKRVQILSESDIKMFLAESDLSDEDMEKILKAATQ